MCPMYPWMMGGTVGGFGMMVGMLLWGLIGLAFLALLVAATIRLLPGRPQEFRSGLSERPSGAREILDERYARGEIDEEEYRRRLRTLTSS